jgi:geranylgeranyl diphosphate synthase, type II
MIGGQLLDLEAEGHELAAPELERIHRLKTGALITVSVAVGGLASRASSRIVDALRRYGEAIGLAFQIADDVLDVTATTDQLGKTAGKDVVFHKSTYPALLGIDGATARAAALVDDGCQALSEAGVHSPELDELARFSIARRS